MIAKLCFWVKKTAPIQSQVILLALLSNYAVAQEYIIKLKNGQLEDSLMLSAPSADFSYKIVDSESDLNLIKIEAETEFINDDPIALMKDYFDAEYVVENVPVYAFIDASDPRRPEQWGLDIVQAAQAWDISAGSDQVVVAVIDSGVFLAHEDLKDNLWVNYNEVVNNGIDDDNNGFVDDINGWDFNGNDNNPNDETSAANPGHGTHCAGIIGASCGNHLGICGVSPQVSLMAVRFLDANGSGDLFASTKAINYAVNNGAHIISASWGATIPQASAQPIIDAIVRAEERGVIFIAAAANDGKSNDTTSVYPANAQTPHMISVAASNKADDKPVWSNYGRKV